MAADAFYARYPVQGGSAAGVASLNSLTGALILAEGSGITITPSGSDTLTIAATGGGGGANTTLSNLDTPTAINQDLLPDTDITYKLGANGAAFLSVAAATVNDPTDAPALDVTNRSLLNESGESKLDYTGADLIVQSNLVGGTDSGTAVLQSKASPAGVSGNLFVRTGSANTISGDVNITTGVPSDPAGQSGAISITTGATTDPGIQGDLTLSSRSVFIQSGAATGGLSGIQLDASASPDGSISMFGSQMILPTGNADPTPLFGGGAMYYNTVTGKFRGYNDVLATWEDLN